MQRLKLFFLIPVILLSACSWFHRKLVVPDPTELVVTGAPKGSTLFIDGEQSGHEKETATRPQIVMIAPGMHTLEVQIGGKVTYRENTYVAPREKHVIVVLSGNRND